MRQMGMMRRLAALGFIASSILGCATSPSKVSPDHVNIVAGTEAGTDTSYRLQVGDSLAIHFLSFPDLDDVGTIGPDGHISLRLISDFPIAGMTLVEASREANARYENVLRHPGVNLVIKSYGLEQIYVDGEVNSPGVIRSTVPLTASGAIAQAGGLKLATARSHGALLVRRTPDGTIVYHQLHLHGDLPTKGDDPILRTNDLIYVPRTAIASVADFVQANVARIVPFVVNPTFVHSF